MEEAAGERNSIRARWRPWTSSPVSDEESVSIELFLIMIILRYEQPTVEGLKEDNIGSKMLQVYI